MLTREELANCPNSAYQVSKANTQKLTNQRIRSITRPADSTVKLIYVHRLCRDAQQWLAQDSAPRWIPWQEA